jgi:hypothetical protein
MWLSAFDVYILSSWNIGIPPESHREWQFNPHTKYTENFIVA